MSSEGVEARGCNVMHGASLAPLIEQVQPRAPAGLCKVRGMKSSLPLQRGSAKPGAIK